MATYYMFGRYSIDAMKGISAERTKKVVHLIEKLDGNVLSMHALLGRYDLVLVVELPGTESAIKASLGATKLTGISFSTSEAISVQEFDKLTKS